MIELLMTFLPLILIMFVISVLVLIFKGGSILPNRLTKHQNRIVIGGYTLVLFVGSIFYFVVVNDGRELADGEEVENEVSQIYSELSSGAFDDFDRLTARESLSLEVLDEVTIEWRSSSLPNYNTVVYIKENETLDHSMEVTVYTPEHILVSGVAIDGQYIAPTVNGQQGSVQIGVPKEVRLEKRVISHEQAVARFLNSDYDVRDRLTRGRNEDTFSALVIELPPGVEMNSEVDQLFDQRES
ncbi:hypothetical protein [Alkalibacillus haloalkaliphilus]|uniref:Uncharacterized protein n=1 Tax=Alkalibacillus haloalkaliphilus TaxID=94136 RepID=A0A511W5R8_9BACI|nr:hypothetical protein [Alkalibacillus haloalkaliphilus]GEN46317.1 hypothetical protein AHA02nite_20930 [Alkalibacillus haloalkaliphilus]